MHTRRRNKQTSIHSCWVKSMFSRPRHGSIFGQQISENRKNNVRPTIIYNLLNMYNMCKSPFSIYETRTEFRQNISENGKPGRFSQHRYFRQMWDKFHVFCQKRNL